MNAPEEANSQLRLQVVQQWIQGTPEIPTEDVQARMQEDEKFAQRIETYVKQLEFQQTQQSNALVGQSVDALKAEIQNLKIQPQDQKTQEQGQPALEDIRLYG